MEYVTTLTFEMRRADKNRFTEIQVKQMEATHDGCHDRQDVEDTCQGTICVSLVQIRVSEQDEGVRTR